MRACASCGRDVIATLYRLRVVIATPRIELGDFCCNAGLIEICVPDAAQAGHVDCGFRLPRSMAVDYCSMRVNADRRSDPAVGPAHFFDQLIFSGSVSQLQKRALHTPACNLPRKMNLMRSRIIWTMLASGGVLIGVGMMQFKLTALLEPGPLETRIANQAKHFTIRRASSHGIPQRQVDTKASREAGATHYGLDCNICHGVDGHAQRAPGRWMYPRATDLVAASDKCM